MELSSNYEPIDIETVLAEEAQAIHGVTLRQEAIYRDLNGIGSRALCLSGGGIRSAAFALGIIQALARSPAQTGLGNLEKLEDSLLGKFHYLSTVSGGGYIGSWLSAWLSRSPNHVWERLVGRPNGPDSEPEQISWLRDNSNYLTPKLGIMSADAWTSVALYGRNLVLNWMVMLPVLLIPLLLLKLTLIAAQALANKSDAQHHIFAALATFAIALLAFACRTTIRNRPSCGRDGLTQTGFLLAGLFPSMLAGFVIAMSVASPSAMSILGTLDRPSLVYLFMSGGAAAYSLGWIFARPNKDLMDLVWWAVAGGIYGAIVGFGVYFFFHFETLNVLLFGLEPPALRVLVLMIYGAPWALTAQITAEMIFVGLTSYQSRSDEDREWLGRSAGWLTVAALAWLTINLLALVGADVFQTYYSKALVAAGGVTGIATALLSGGASTPALGAAKTMQGLSSNVALAIVAPVFAAIIMIGSSAALDQLLLGHELLRSQLLGGGELQLLNEREQLMPTAVQDLFWLASGLLGLVLIGVLASKRINVNRFSLHALYRNRLIRAFLGASNENRHANAFTNFDLTDNLFMSSLWPTRKAAGQWPEVSNAGWRPFHVVNMALNIVSTRRLAWQERKAEPFTASPLHAGSACKSFRYSAEYGGPDGITLGTAMAISGAAASPNMGYHSSPGVAFLMALLNVRLGWWLGNPGVEGDGTFRLEGPSSAVAPLLMEMFGLTSDDKEYVYLTDGGHFENLGLYEMVRRRCRFILVVDAACDPDFAFEDLGNAVRKIALDLGVTITFTGLDKLRNRPKESADVLENQPYHAIGKIDYPTADHGGHPGTILYVKPSYHGVESAGVKSYAIANKDFPHQSTVDQWFSESQFESYRALGFEIMTQILPVCCRESALACEPSVGATVVSQGPEIKRP